MTPVCQGVLLALFAIGAFFFWRGGLAAVRQVFAQISLAACAVLALIQTLYATEAHLIPGVTQIAIGMLLLAVGLEAIDRRQNPRVRAAAGSLGAE